MTSEAAAPPRPCGHSGCGKPLEIRDRESTRQFALRRYCSNGCAALERNRNRNRPTPRPPKPIGPATVPEPEPDTSISPRVAILAALCGGPKLVAVALVSACRLCGADPVEVWDALAALESEGKVRTWNPVGIKGRRTACLNQSEDRTT